VLKRLFRINFGNKQSIGELCWQIFGNPDLYIEPFAGALGVYLNRPPERDSEHIRTEVLCDYSALITNVWRSLKLRPERTAEFCSDGSKMADYHARHKWLMEYDKGALYERLVADPYYCDPEAAGVYIWLLSNAIGGHSELENNPRGCAADTERKTLQGIPHASGAGKGVNALRRIPHASNAGTGVCMGAYARGGVHICEEPLGPGAEPHGIIGGRYYGVLEQFEKLQERLADTDIMCADFMSMLDNPCRFLTHSQISRRTNCAVFLDPPYNLGGDYLYGNLDVSRIHAPLVEWCINHERIFKTCKVADREIDTVGYIRVILTAHEGEYDELLDYGWHKIEGKTINGYSHLSADEEKLSGAGREAIYLSPQAWTQYEKTQAPLFA